MQASEIYTKLRSQPAGSHISVAWIREAKCKKGCPLVQKKTVAFVRSGINFANLGSVKEGISSGERGEVQSLPWGTWRNGFEKYIIDHTSKDGVSKEYVRLYPATFENLRPQVTWYLEDKVVEYSQIEEYLLSSEKPKDEIPECFTVSADSVFSVG